MPQPVPSKTILGVDFSGSNPDGGDYESRFTERWNVSHARRYVQNALDQPQTYTVLDHVMIPGIEVIAGTERVRFLGLTLARLYDEGATP